MTPPRREEVENVFRGLIAGRLSRDEVTDWAMRWYNDDSIRIEDEGIRKALYCLTSADAISTDRPYLFGQEDFEAWYKDFLEP